MTVKQISFHPDAIDEAEAAARWYRQRSVRAAARFVDEVNEAIERIVAAPKRWPLGPRGTRKVKLPCFPFFESAIDARSNLGSPSALSGV